MAEKGFLDILAEALCMSAMIEASKDENGKPDPYKAAGAAYGMGLLNSSNIGAFGAMLGEKGAFDD